MTTDTSPGEMEERILLLIRSFKERLTNQQSEVLVELAQHNEPAIAVLVLSNVLKEIGLPIARERFNELSNLVTLFELDRVLSTQLEPLVEPRLDEPRFSP